MINTETQVVNWPEESGTYKVVQLDVDGQPYLRFQPGKDREYHSSILRTFLTDNKIDFRETLEPLGAPIPELKGERYTVRGMGKERVDVGQKIAAFSGVSADYEIGINEAHLDSLRPLVPGWGIDREQGSGRLR